jgi:hypothetical protein
MFRSNVRCAAAESLRMVVVCLFIFPAVSRAQETSSAPEKAFEVRTIDRPPRIDGAIEDVWLTADAVDDFVQKEPYERTAPTERTTVYVLQDAENLYVAFRCDAEQHPPTACLTKDEDYVAIYLDPFGSKTTGYFFLVYGSGLFWDGLVLDDGRSQDLSWEGVWSRAVRLYPDRMEVEMKIPFKTIRYKQGLSEWGVQFFRHIAANFENDYWTEVTQKDDDMVSRWGTGRGLQPRSTGYYFEVYPESYVRHDKYRGHEAEDKIKASLTVKWDVTPQTSLNATAYPDFAQIESDPSSINLSRYPTFLSEQRPFFIDGMEVFRSSSLSNTGSYEPLNIFYSRRIGKSLDGDAVPILGGLKLTHKTEDWNLGVLGAYTDSYTDKAEEIDEPARRFGVVRAQRRLFKNSGLGVTASGMYRNADDRNYAIGLDGVWRQGTNQLVLQGARSDHSGKTGWATSNGYSGFWRDILTVLVYEAVHDSFDVADVGFVPWAGRQKVVVSAGPFFTFKQGALRNLYVGTGVMRNRDPGGPRWATLGSLEANANWRNQWGSGLTLTGGKNYEFDPVRGGFVDYTYRSYNFNWWGLAGGNNVNGGGEYRYSYNYARGYPGWQGANWLTLSHSFLPPLSVTMGGNLWLEWDEGGRILAMWPRLRPKADLRISPYMTLSVFDELMSSTPEAELGKTRLISNRIGFIYSWNFAPKSWVYAALNDYSELDFADHPGGLMRPEYRIAAIKVKYLVYF